MFSNLTSRLSATVLVGLVALAVPFGVSGWPDSTGETAAATACTLTTPTSSPYPNGIITYPPDSTEPFQIDWYDANGVHGVKIACRDGKFKEVP